MKLVYEEAEKNPVCMCCGTRERALISLHLSGLRSSTGPMHKFILCPACIEKSLVNGLNALSPEQYRAFMEAMEKTRV